MAEIKPIETVYNGYRFRSRLEARWAVFFDALGIRYEYEKEGFTLSTGEKYLPDFYLPDLGVWAEVKPTRNIEAIPKSEYGVMWSQNNGYWKLQKLCDDLGDAGILLEGLPLDCWYQVVLCDTTDSSGGTYFDEPCATFAVDKYGKAKILINEWRADRTFFTRGWGSLENVVNVYDFNPPPYISAGDCLHIVLEDDQLYKQYKPYKAAIAARQARFEHGETPRI